MTQKHYVPVETEAQKKLQERARKREGLRGRGRGGFAGTFTPFASLSEDIPTPVGPGGAGEPGIGAFAPLQERDPFIPSGLPFQERDQPSIQTTGGRRRLGEELAPIGRFFAAADAPVDYREALIAFLGSAAMTLPTSGVSTEARLVLLDLAQGKETPESAYGKLIELGETRPFPEQIAAGVTSPLNLLPIPGPQSIKSGAQLVGRLAPTVTKIPKILNVPAIRGPVGHAIRPSRVARADDFIQTGLPFEGTFFRGTGRATVEGVYDPHFAQAAIFGEATYTTPSREFASTFGPQVSQVEVRLNNPLVISSDREWRALTREAGLMSNTPLSVDEIGKLRQSVLNKGHDGVVVNVPTDEMTGKSLQQAFGQDTVVQFGPQGAVTAPPPQIGAAQASMGIGENPPQAQLFEGLRGEAQRVPLADAEQLAARQARQAEIAAGQGQLLESQQARVEAASAEFERLSVQANKAQEEARSRLRAEGKRNQFGMIESPNFDNSPEYAAARLSMDEAEDVLNREVVKLNLIQEAWRKERLVAGQTDLPITAPAKPPIRPAEGGVPDRSAVAERMGLGDIDAITAKTPESARVELTNKIRAHYDAAKELRYQAQIYPDQSPRLLKQANESEAVARNLERNFDEQVVQSVADSKKVIEEVNAAVDAEVRLQAARTAVDPPIRPTKPTVTPAARATSDAVIEEAKKFKTAESFVESMYTEPSYSLVPGQTILSKQKTTGRFHGTSPENVQEILSEGKIAARVTELDAAGQTSVSVSGNRAVAESYGNIVFELDPKLRVYEPPSGAVKGDYYKGFEFRHPRDIPLSRVRAAFINLGLDEGLDTRLIIGWERRGEPIYSTIGQVQKQLEDKGLKVYVANFSDKKSLADIWHRAQAPAPVTPGARPPAESPIRPVEVPPSAMEAQRARVLSDTLRSGQTIEELERRIVDVRRQLSSGMSDELRSLPGGKGPFAQFEFPAKEVDAALERLAIEEEQLTARLRALIEHQETIGAPPTATPPSTPPGFLGIPGRGIEERLALEGGRARRLGGNTQNMPPPETVASRVEAQQNIAREAYDAVPGSPVDEAATAYWQTGNFDDFIARSGPPDDPFPVLPGFAEEAFDEVGRVSGRFADPTRLVQAIDQGQFGSALQRAVLWPTRRTFLASLKFGDSTKQVFHAVLQKHGMLGWRNRNLRNLAGDVLEHIADARTPLDTLLSRPAIKAILANVPEANKARIVAFAQDSRRFFDDVLTKQNQARAARGQSPIPHLENYRPWVRETNLWSRLGFGDKPMKEIAQGPLMPDFIKPDAPFNPRAQARTGGLRDYEKIRDLQRLGMDYVDTASKDIFYTNIVQNAKVHIRQLRDRGLENAAASIEDWIMEAYAGKLSSFSKGVRETIPPVIVKGALHLRRNLTRSVFPLNWTWNMFVQTSSGALTIHRFGIKDTLKGLSYLTSPSIRRAVRENAYSAIMKRRRGGRAALQDIGPGVEKTARLESTPIETVEDFTNLLTSAIEDALTGISVRAAYHSGQRQGLSGRALWEFASEGGSKTQSMYNLQDIPGVLRTREVGAIAPFQTFAFEVMNTVRELGLPGLGRIGMHKTTQNRLLSIARWVAAMAAFSAVGDQAINRKPWQLSSFIPFWGLVTGGLNAGNPWNYALPLKYSADFKRGLDDYLRHGDWKRLRSWAIQYHMLGGTQINRTLRGIEAVADGKVTDVAGKTLFEVSDEEAWKVITQGPYAAAEGQEYIDELQERKGPFAEFTGIPLPEMPSSLERKWRVEIKAYEDIPTDPLKIGTKEFPYSRTEYRRRNPEIDAKLFITGDVRTLHTLEAMEAAHRLIQEHGVDPGLIRGIELRQADLEKLQELGRPPRAKNYVDLLIEKLEVDVPTAPIRESQQGPRFKIPERQLEPIRFKIPRLQELVGTE